MAPNTNSNQSNSEVGLFWLRKKRRKEEDCAVLMASLPQPEFNTNWGWG